MMSQSDTKALGADLLIAGDKTTGLVAKETGTRLLKKLSASGGDLSHGDSVFRLEWS